MLSRNMKMRMVPIFLILTTLFIHSTNADWNILNQKAKYGPLKMSLKNYCEGWKTNVEMNNIRGFEIVPEECVEYIGKYMKSKQYNVDFERAIEESTVYFSTSCNLKKDGRDAWVFDVDDTLLSTLPYYKNHNFGGEQLNITSLEEWKKQAKAPVLESALGLFNEIKKSGVHIIIISSRREHLRSATIDNLVKVGYYGWTSLLLRGFDDEKKNVQTYKANIREELTTSGYRVWGIVGDQWSSIEGSSSSTVKRAFKLPNPMYYVP